MRPSKNPNAGHQKTIACDALWPNVPVKGN